MNISKNPRNFLKNGERLKFELPIIVSLLTIIGTFTLYVDHDYTRLRLKESKGIWKEEVSKNFWKS